MFTRFRPTAEDERTIRTLERECESGAEVLRRGLRSLERCPQEQARADAARRALTTRS